MRNLILKDKRICYACGSNKSKLNKQHKHQYEEWFLNKPTRLVICSNCYHNIFFQQKFWQREHRKKCIMFKGRRIYVGRNPRTGICSNCGKQGKTNLHHSQYDDSNPLANTAELCTSCHAKETWRLGQASQEILHKNGIRFQYIPPRDPKTGRFRGFV